MNAAIGRLHLSVTIAPTLAEDVTAPDAEPQNDQLERAFTRAQIEREVDADRRRWTSTASMRGLRS